MSTATATGPTVTHDDAVRVGVDPYFFVNTYCSVLDAVSGAWMPFRVWPAQRDLLRTIRGNQFTAALKARQLGFTWLCLGFALHELLSKATTALLFSRTDLDAKELMGRLTGMLARLPPEIRPAIISESRHEVRLSNGGRALSFPTTGGRSYTAGFALVDEADHVPDLQSLLDAVKPTVDAGGRLVLLSTPDKSRPQSLFKRIYYGARNGENNYAPFFRGWRARPGRTDEWHEREKQSSLSQTGSLDHLHQEYPDTDAEALSPRTLDKRIAPAWLEQCYTECAVVDPLPSAAPSIPGLVVYRPPCHGRVYVIGADPAEGNPQSDESAAAVLDAETGEECAALAGKLEPAVFAAHVDALGDWYHGALVMVERNNHGHAVLLWLREYSTLPILCGHDGAEGWLSSVRGKALLYAACADAFRNRETTLHSFATLVQLQSIEGASLRAPEGENDDRADAYALALAALAYDRGDPAGGDEGEATVLRA